MKQDKRANIDNDVQILYGSPKKVMNTSSTNAEESVISACETTATSQGYRLRPYIFGRT